MEHRQESVRNAGKQSENYNRREENHYGKIIYQ